MAEQQSRTVINPTPMTEVPSVGFTPIMNRVSDAKSPAYAFVESVVPVLDKWANRKQAEDYTEVNNVIDTYRAEVWNLREQAEQDRDNYKTYAAKALRLQSEARSAVRRAAIGDPSKWGGFTSAIEQEYKDAFTFSTEIIGNATQIMTNTGEIIVSPLQEQEAYMRNAAIYVDDMQKKEPAAWAAMQDLPKEQQDTMLDYLKRIAQVTFVNNQELGARNSKQNLENLDIAERQRQAPTQRAAFARQIRDSIDKDLRKVIASDIPVEVKKATIASSLQTMVTQNTLMGAMGEKAEAWDLYNWKDDTEASKYIMDTVGSFYLNLAEATDPKALLAYGTEKARLVKDQAEFMLKIEELEVWSGVNPRLRAVMQDPNAMFNLDLYLKLGRNKTFQTEFAGLDASFKDEVLAGVDRVLESQNNIAVINQQAFSDTTKTDLQAFVHALKTAKINVDFAKSNGQIRPTNMADMKVVLGTELATLYEKLRNDPRFEQLKTATDIPEEARRLIQEFEAAEDYMARYKKLPEVQAEVLNTPELQRFRSKNREVIQRLQENYIAR